MSNEVLNSLLKEYEQKKIKEELDLEKRKENLYSIEPKLKQIDDELNNFAILTAKNILRKGNGSLLELQQKSNFLKKEKEKILKLHDLDIDYLKPFYSCKTCNDTGYITDNNYKTQMCTCLKQKLLNVSFNKSNMSNLNTQNFDNFNENLFSDEVDLAKYKFNISPRSNIKNIKNKCIEFIENFDNPDYKNLLFTGNTGLR